MDPDDTRCFHLLNGLLGDLVEGPASKEQYVIVEQEVFTI